MSQDILPCEFLLFLYVRKPLKECRLECIDTMSIAIVGFSCCLSVDGCRGSAATWMGEVQGTWRRVCGVEELGLWFMLIEYICEKY
jgi:hypothetical protein